MEPIRLLPSSAEAQARGRVGFTLLELLVMTTVLIVLGALFFPSRAQARSKGQDMVCSDNLRRLILGWQLYYTDHQDKLVMVFHGGEAQGGVAAQTPSYAPWTVGWLDWTTSPDNTNTLFLTSDKYSRLATYLGHTPRVFKCPSDVYLSAAQRQKGWTSRARSISANLAVGDGNAESGPWDSIYKHVRKSTEFVFPPPGRTFVYLEEHPDSINDPGFFCPTAAAWVDQPASYHNGAAAFSFADGHCELHKWQASLAAARPTRVKYNNALDAPVVRGDADLHWVSERAPRQSAISY